MKDLEKKSERLEKKVNILKNFGIPLLLVLTLSFGVNANEKESLKKSIVIRQDILNSLLVNGKYIKSQINNLKDYILKSPLSVSQTFYYDTIRKEFFDIELLKNDKFFKKVYNFNNFKKYYKQIYYFYINNWEKFQDKIFIFRSYDFDGKFILLYYQGDVLKVATFVSPGKGKNKTPVWNFKVVRKEIIHFSEQYNNTPMFFSLYLGQGGFYIHNDKKVDGYPKSHGCIRVTLLASKILFDNVKINTPVVFVGYSKQF